MKYDGVLPSVMLYELMRVCTFGESLWCFVPLLIAVCSAWRLAKFNLDDRQGHSFLGLPTPACAMVCGSPEQLIADGALSRFFGSDTLRFDPATRRLIAQ